MPSSAFFAPTFGMLTRDRDNPQNCYNGYERIAEDSERLHQFLALLVAGCGNMPGRHSDALPAFHCDHGMFQSPSPSTPDSVEPTVFCTSTMSPRLVLL